MTCFVLLFLFQCKLLLNIVANTTEVGIDHRSPASESLTLSAAPRRPLQNHGKSHHKTKNGSSLNFFQSEYILSLRVKKERKCKLRSFSNFNTLKSNSSTKSLWMCKSRKWLKRFSFSHCLTTVGRETLCSANTAKETQ